LGIELLDPGKLNKKAINAWIKTEKKIISDRLEQLKPIESNKKIKK